jgi:hypothetical protein
MRSCLARYFGFLRLKSRNGSTNSGRSARREMSKAPYLFSVDFAHAEEVRKANSHSSLGRFAFLHYVEKYAARTSYLERAFLSSFINFSVSSSFRITC